MDYVTIDFEASCLPRHGRSFPIEVGIAGPGGVRSWLIRPHALWRDWDWTEQARKLHGLSPARLDEEGFEPHDVLAALVQAIGRRRVIADSTIDTYWWNTLAAAAMSNLASPIEHVSGVLDELGATADDIRLGQRCADALCPARHRAAADARWLRTLLTTIERAVEARKPLPVPLALAVPLTAWPGDRPADRMYPARSATPPGLHPGCPC